MPRKTEVFRLLSGLRDSERGRGMRFTPSIFGKLLEPIKRRQFDSLVARHAGDADVKSFPSWNHLLALVYAQFSAAISLRGLEAGWNANSQHHYHLGSGPLVRSVRCQQTATGCSLRGDLQRGGKPTGSADATRRRGNAEADRCDPHSARQAVRRGQIERAHSRPEDA